MATIRKESAFEYFEGQVYGAMANQRVESSELTVFYVVNLLVSFVRRVGLDSQALAPSFLEALQTGGTSQRSVLRHVGDQSLFVSGFFSDSLRRKLVDVDYYVSIGGAAYDALSQVESDTLSSVFAQLAEKFVGFVDVLAEVSERMACTTDTGLLRLYEKWVRTGSKRSARLLVERGVLPNPSIRRMRIH